MKRIVIIGGGLSGTLCALSLFRQDTGPLSITIIEKADKQLLKGAAYSSELPHQLLNVPVMGMSVLEDQADHFWQWIQKQSLPANYGPHDFVPRDLFGRYIGETFRQFAADSGQELKTVIATVEDITRADKIFTLSTREGKKIYADRVVLCIGNLPPQHLPNIQPDCLLRPTYVQNPWSGDYLNYLDKQDEILLVGTGLTMVDQLLSLHKNGHLGKIRMLSRRGFLPQAHGEAPEYKMRLRNLYDTRTVSGCVRWLRNEIVLAQRQGASWISVINSIRDQTPEIWSQFSEKEKSRFLRHVRPYWEVHRHRIPKESAAIIADLMASGRVEKLAGRIKDVSWANGDFKVQMVPRGSSELVSFNTHWVINCTGPHSNIRKSGNKLINNLIEKGVLDTDPLSVGLVVKEHKQDFFLVGPPAKGTYWECTALREILKYAGEVARLITHPSNSGEIYETEILSG